jgi:hypothetical protein
MQLMIIAGVMFASCQMVSGAEPKETNRQEVAETAGLVAFWDFTNSKDSAWISYYDARVVDRSYPLISPPQVQPAIRSQRPMDRSTPGVALSTARLLKIISGLRWP